MLAKVKLGLLAFWYSACRLFGASDLLFYLQSTCGSYSYFMVITVRKE
jgi:hypothetical protein